MSDKENSKRPDGAASNDGGSGQKADETVAGRSQTQPIDMMSRSGASLVGCRLGEYQILRKLGRGGMADVYASRHLSLGRDVAIKVLRSDFARDQDYVSRFRREARAAAKLNQSNIVQVYDVGSVEDVHFIAQELIDGENLKERLQSLGSLSSAEAIETMVAVAKALESASEVGITHRDIKPENIMRSSRGDIKVADFGLARIGMDGDATSANLTQAGLTMGTPRYMSPEQVQGKVVDVRSDLYSLGVTMYHLLAGRPPFEADDPLALAVLHLHETAPPLDRARGKDDLPEWLIAIVDRLMSKLPGDRFQSPQDLLDAIQGEVSVGTAIYDAKGTAAATIRLQRATDAAKKQKRAKVTKVLCFSLLPLLLGGAAIAYAMNQPEVTVSDLLRPKTATKASSVQEQFVIAMTRDDVAAWNAVGEYVPRNENSTNLAYYAKSMIQISRVYAGQDKVREAEQALESVANDPKIDRKYQMVALAKLVTLSEQHRTNDPHRSNKLDETRSRLESLYQDLATSNPEIVDYFNRVVPREERMWLEVGVGDSSDT